MNSENLKLVLEACRKSNITPFIWGDSGIGKSETIKQYAQDNGFEFVDLRIGTQEAGDLIGLPTKEDGRTVWLKPEWFPKDGTKGVLFLDELNRGRPDVLQAIFQLVLDRKLNTHTLPEEWSIIAAGNPSTDDFFVADLDRALMNRFCHLRFDVDYNAWSAHAKKVGVDSKFVDFVNTFRPFDKKKEIEFNLDIIPTPRSVTMASELIKHLPDTKSIQREALMGVVGLETATQMLEFLSGNVQDKISVSEIFNFDTKIETKLNKLIKESRLDTLDESLTALISYVKANSKNMKGAQIKNMFKFIGACPKDMGERVLLSPDFEPIFDIDKFLKNGGLEILEERTKEENK